MDMCTIEGHPKGYRDQAQEIRKTYMLLSTGVGIRSITIDARQIGRRWPTNAPSQGLYQ